MHCLNGVGGVKRTLLCLVCPSVLFLLLLLFPLRLSLFASPCIRQMVYLLVFLLLLLLLFRFLPSSAFCLLISSSSLQKRSIYIPTTDSPPSLFSLLVVVVVVLLSLFLNLSHMHIHQHTAPLSSLFFSPLTTLLYPYSLSHAQE